MKCFQSRFFFSSTNVSNTKCHNTMYGLQSVMMLLLCLSFKSGLQEPLPSFNLMDYDILQVVLMHCSIGFWLNGCVSCSFTAGSDLTILFWKILHRPDPVICMFFIHKLHLRHRTPGETTPQWPVCTNSQTAFSKPSFSSLNAYCSQLFVVLWEKILLACENQSSTGSDELSLRPASWTHGTWKSETAFRDMFCTFLLLWVKVEQLAWFQHGRRDNNNYGLSRATLIARSLMAIQYITLHLRYSLCTTCRVSNFDCIDNFIDSVEFFWSAMYETENSIAWRWQKLWYFPLFFPSNLLNRSYTIYTNWPTWPWSRLYDCYVWFSNHINMWQGSHQCSKDYSIPHVHTYTGDDV